MGREVESIGAYQVLERRKISDLNSEGYVLLHKKTGAAVTLLLNDDENKVFYIGFRTPPKDSTGVAHILEHSVLCGSKNFPVKDPFVELAKGSLNTFLTRWQAVMTRILKIWCMCIWTRSFIPIFTGKRRFSGRRAGTMRWRA